MYSVDFRFMHRAEFRGTDRYRVVRRLGQGGMGVVYEAQDDLRNETVALKTFRTHDSDSLYRLKQEFRRLVDIDHPNLVCLFDLVVSSEASFFTMELVRGLDFSAYCGAPRLEPLPPSASAARMPPPTGGAGLKSTPAHDAHRGPATTGGARIEPSAGHGPDHATTGPARTELTHGANIPKNEPPGGRRLACDEARLRVALPQLVSGVRALHNAGKLHRDIKPSNVLIDASDRLKLLDFGLALDLRRLPEESLVGGIIGTVAYMSPEQAAGETDLGPPSDLYSIGVLIYGALTGRLPFSGEPWKIMSAKQDRPAPPPRQVVPSVPEDLDDLCVRLLKRKPEQRPSADEVLERLGQVPKAGHGALGSSSRPSAGRFTGRRRELDCLERAMTQTRRGQPAVVLVSGASGIGKSALVREFLARVRRRLDDLVVLQGRCFERETMPYQAMDNLIDDFSRVWNRMPDSDAASLLPLDVTPLVRLFPVLGRVPAIAGAPAGAEVEDPQERRTRGFAALREVFQRLCRRQPIALFLDDMQWVDADTVTLLADILRPPEAPPLLVLLGARSESSPDVIARLSSQTADLGATVQRLALAPLPIDEAEAMAKSLLEREPAGMAKRIATESAGSPFFIAELADTSVLLLARQRRSMTSSSSGSLSFLLRHGRYSNCSLSPANRYRGRSR